ncbi:hypothetical protein [Alloactinosynnema sp. L-07]|uniref:hypothetical protein n=1 Tax=Alloactinosynnema sp. L-07 TaxID=1653480 RepID=UPI00065EFD18|nr:hypothetical protein [Alloactinosynnema sp. L-07]CRK57705.1 hypothetical protein [Alloactinosynnema sp. L-07]
MGIAERKLVELRDKLAGVTAEFAWWLSAAEERGTLRKHQSQLRRLTSQLDGYATEIARRLDQAETGGDILEAGRAMQVRILEVHRLWDHFRSKFALRYLPAFSKYLGLADEFVWACYRPILDAAEAPGDPAMVKEAPLVFFSGQYAPITHQRNVPFTTESVKEEHSIEFLQLVQRLPVPLIGLPWYQASHLPDMVLIAHEVGHTVERDFEMAEVTVKQFYPPGPTLPAATRDSWLRWLPEVFADVFATLSVGDAYLSGLADLLAVEPRSDKPPAEEKLRYPPATVRVAIGAEVLRRMNLTGKSDARLADWRTVHPRPGDADSLNPFLADVSTIVDCLLGARYPRLGGRTLRECVKFEPTAEELDDDIDLVLQGRRPYTIDVRTVVALARLAFERDPAGFLAKNDHVSVEQWILDHGITLIDNKSRASVITAVEDKDDRAAGVALFDTRGDPHD